MYRFKFSIVIKIYKPIIIPIHLNIGYFYSRKVPLSYLPINPIGNHCSIFNINRSISYRSYISGKT